jgi:hypothetical protein
MYYWLYTTVNYVNIPHTTRLYPTLSRLVNPRCLCRSTPIYLSLVVAFASCSYTVATLTHWPTLPPTSVVKHLATRGTAPKPPSRNGNGRPLTSCGQKQPFASPRSRPVSHRQCNATATTAAPITGSDQALVTYRVSLICELMEIQSSHSLV